MIQDQDIALSVGGLIDLLGVKGVVVLLTLAGLYLLKFKPVREAAKRTLRRLAKALVRYVRLTLWAARLGIGVRLALRLQPERWREMCEARKLKGLKRGRVKRSPIGVDVRVTLNGSLTLETLNARVKDLETGLGTRRGAIRIVPGATAHKAIVRIAVRNPLAKMLKWDVPARPISIKDPAYLAMNPFGDRLEIDLQQRILIVGASGSGKSSVQRILSGPVLMSADAELEMWDLKQGTESQHYEGRVVYRATNADQCAERIAYLLDTELPRRAAILRDLKTSTWPTSAKHPDRIVMIDEIAAAVRELDDDDLDRLFTLIEQARAYGIYLWIATQFPKSDNLPTQVRSQMGATIALKMKRGSESRVVFEDLAKEGWTPHRLPGTGWLMLHDEDHDDPQEWKAPFLSVEDFRKLPVDTPDGPSVPPQMTKKQEPILPEQAALHALQQAGDQGAPVAAIQQVTGLGKSQAYTLVNRLIESGKAVKVKHGRYAIGEEAAA